MQSQDYTAAKWALGQRTLGATDRKLDRLVDEGRILRTHLMRPTWHFVLPEDIRWLLDLTGPRVQLGLASRYRQLEIDERVIGRAIAAFVAALSGGHHLTRPELGAVLQAAGISPDGQRLPHLISAAELNGVIASGPRRGKQFTYALLAERAPKARVLDRAKALGELAKRYFRSHGPAQVQDFVWWSGLTMADARTGITGAGAALAHEVADGKEYWFDAQPDPIAKSDKTAHLLPNFDEYTVAYRDRAAAIHPDVRFEPSLFSFSSILANVVVVAGRVRGAWRRTSTPAGVRVEIRLLARLKPAEVAAVEAAARRLGGYLERPVQLVWL